jgi:16S rRNA (cytosine967-C5)-methyltransferase
VDDLPDPRTGRQVREYVAGVTRWRRWLDFLIDHFYRGQAMQMEPTLRQVLRIGLYDLFLLDTPPHAALHEAVELAKRLVRPGAGGLVNGILRSALRAAGDLPQPAMQDEAERLAIRYSHPTWMVRRWLERYGAEETRRLLEANNARPVYGVRVNTHHITPEAFHARLDEEGISWEASPYLDDFVRIRRLQPVIQAGLLADGSCMVQDEGAGLVVRLLDPQPDETVLDACAAPGGKALYAASRMQGRGRVLAYDVHPGRIRLVSQAAGTLGLTNVVAEAADLRDLAGQQPPPAADRVLLDVPCSGLGVLAKRADLRWQRTPEDMAELVALQDDLLDAAAALVRPGGVLVYSTCTIEPEENEDRVSAFLERHGAFVQRSAGGLVPEGLATAEGFYAALPHRDGIDGAFAARLERRRS